MSQTQPMKYYKLPENVLTGILEYLKNRPYAEVTQGIQALMTLEVIPDNASPVEHQQA